MLTVANVVEYLLPKMLTGHLIILFCKCEFAASLSVCFVYLYIYSFVGAGVLSDGDCVVKSGCSHHVEHHVHTMLNTPESLLTSIFYICYFAYVIEMKEKRKEADWCTNLLPEAVYHLILSCIPVQSKVF